MNSETSTSGKLVEIRKRLRANKLTAKDIRQLEKIVLRVEKAAKELRGAMVE